MSLESLPLPAIVAQLRKLCQEKHTGNFYLLVNNHLHGRIGIQNGEIVILASAGKHGLDALPSILSIQSGSVVFNESPVSGASPVPLPSTQELLARLDGNNPATTTATAESSAASPNRALSATAKTVLEQTLREFIGPIASVLCTHHFRTATTLAAAIDALADEIPDPKAAARFHELARKRLD